MIDFKYISVYLCTIKDSGDLFGSHLISSIQSPEAESYGLDRRCISHYVTRVNFLEPED